MGIGVVGSLHEGGQTGNGYWAVYQCGNVVPVASPKLAQI